MEAVNTNASSNMNINSVSRIPQIVHTDNKPNKIESENIEGISDDSKVSYSPSNKSNVNSNKELQCIGENARRTEELKKLVSNICKQEIQTEMSVIQEEIGDITTKMSEKN
jgi:hypothetical protein